MWPTLIRLVSTAIRIIPATIIIGGLTYIGLDALARRITPGPEVEDERKKRGF